MPKSKLMVESSDQEEDAWTKRQEGPRSNKMVMDSDPMPPPRVDTDMMHTTAHSVTDDGEGPNLNELMDAQRRQQAVAYPKSQISLDRSGQTGEDLGYDAKTISPIHSHGGLSGASRPIPVTPQDSSQIKPPHKSTDHRRSSLAAATPGEFQQRTNQDSPASRAVQLAQQTVPAHGYCDKMGSDHKDDYPPNNFSGRANSRNEMHNQGSVADHDDDVNHGDGLNRGDDASHMKYHDGQTARRQAVNQNGPLQHHGDQRYAGANSMKRTRTVDSQDSVARNEKRMRPAPNSAGGPSGGFVGYDYSQSHNGQGPSPLGGYSSQNAILREGQHNDDFPRDAKSRGRYTQNPPDWELPMSRDGQYQQSGGNGRQQHPKIMPNFAAPTQPTQNRFGTVSDAGSQRQYRNAGGRTSTDWQFGPHQQGLSQARPQDRPSFPGDSSFRDDHGDEDDISGKLGSPPRQGAAQSGYPGGNRHSAGNLFYNDQGAIFHRGTAQHNAQYGSDPSAQGLRYESDPPLMPGPSMQYLSQPRPNLSYSSSGATWNSTKKVMGDDDDEAPREANRCRARADNAAEGSVAETIPGGSGPISEQRRAQIARIRNDVEFYNLKRTQEFVELDMDKSLMMAIKIRKFLEYEPGVKDEDRSPNSTSRDKPAPLAMTLEEFSQKSPEERHIISRRKTQRDNLYIRACRLVMGLNVLEENNSDIGEHIISSKSTFAKERSSGKSKGVQNPDNVFLVLDFDLFRTPFVDIARLLTLAARHCRVKKKFTYVSVHSRYNRSAREMCETEGRRFHEIATRKKTLAGKNRTKMAAHGPDTEDELDEDESELDGAVNNDEPANHDDSEYAGERLFWTSERDDMLRFISSEYEEKKYQLIADRMNEALNLPNHPSVLSAIWVKKRYERLGLSTQQPPQ